MIHKSFLVGAVTLAFVALVNMPAQQMGGMMGAMMGGLPEAITSETNPITTAKVNLGRMLFYETRLSKGVMCRAIPAIVSRTMASTASASPAATMANWEGAIPQRSTTRPGTWLSFGMVGRWMSRSSPKDPSSIPSRWR